jgi:hypothetical protein
MKNYLLAALVILHSGVWAQKPAGSIESDRKYWSDLCYKISAPVLSRMSKGELVKTMTVEYAPTFDNRNKKVAYMETFGRLMAGISPWLSLPEDNTPEGKQRKQLKEWALLSYRHAVDPQSPDYLLWKGEGQILVDAAFLAQSFIRAPKTFWEPLDSLTKKRYVELFKTMRVIRPAYSNWLLFRAMIEAFLVYAGEQPDGLALGVTARKMEEWYLSDGFYSDGPDFAMDYYNAFVIHPMYVEILEMLEPKNFFDKRISSFSVALERMQRYNRILERLISPEGTFPPVGRSITYRMAAFQTLALSAWKYGLPKEISNGQVRSALTAVMKRMFTVDGNFNKEGFLQLGFAGHQPDLANSYTNSGSLYMMSLVFMPLGLAPDHAFWTAPAEKWTALKAWSGEAFPMDKSLH